MLKDQAVTDLLALEADAGLLEQEALAERVAALEQLAFIYQVLQASGRAAAAYGARAAALRARLEAANEGYYTRVRHWLRSGAASGGEVRALLGCYSRYGQPDDAALHLDYEPADALVDGVLGLDGFTGNPTVEHPDIVHLEDTPVRALLDLVDHVPLEQDDCFCDLGAGLGRAAIVVHWLTGAPALGIEIQPDYSAYARRLAASLGLKRVTFVQADAREADLSAGTVFYLFTPFKGRILRTVLDRLHAQAQQRTITVCTYGAVSLIVAREPWLRPLAGGQPHEFALGVWRSA